MDINPALDLDTIGDFTKMPFDDQIVKLSLGAMI
jgi:hypothetical protein